jgi:hypothetical protein
MVGRVRSPRRVSRRSGSTSGDVRRTRSPRWTSSATTTCSSMPRPSWRALPARRATSG